MLFKNPRSRSSDHTFSASEAMESIIAAQIRAEVNVRMDKLQQRLCNEKPHPELWSEIRDYLTPSHSSSRERIVKSAIEKMHNV